MFHCKNTKIVWQKSNFFFGMSLNKYPDIPAWYKSGQVDERRTWNWMSSP